MTEPTTDRPTDTIRDAFEAMLIFLEALLTGILRGSADPTHTLATNAADAIEAVRRTDPHLLAFRDLVTRAAEEHNRRAPLSPAEEAEIIASAPGQIGPGLTPIGRADWTPERIREARERCAEIERRYQAGLESASNREDLALTVLAIRAAREDLPAALREIERLTAELAARAPADASLEARAKHAAQVYDDACVAPDDNADEQAWLAVVRAVDASRPRLTERDADDIELARAVRDTLREVTHAGAIERLEELLDVEKEAAARPGLTEEQARLDFETACREARARGGAYCITKLGEALSTLDAALRASRGETGPAPTGLTSAMHAAQQRRSVPPASAFGEWPDEPRGGLTCPGCYDATGIAQPHDPRATLHAGDPASPFAPGSLAAGSATEDRILDRKRGGK